MKTVFKSPPITPILNVGITEKDLKDLELLEQKEFMRLCREAVLNASTSSSQLIEREVKVRKDVEIMSTQPSVDIPRKVVKRKEFSVF